MAAFPPLPQIVGKHGGVYEAYYMQADPMGTGSIGALDAANFLKKSNLSDTILSQVWDMSDPMGKGYLEKTGFFVALKLIALVQSKQELNISKLVVETPPPDLGPVEPVDTTQIAFTTNIPWDVTLSEKSKYDKVFDSLQPVNNMLSGDKVKPVLMNSQLPVDILGRIWDMSDIDKDGYLDRDEFAVAMHLVYQAREGQDIPSIMRPGLVPPSKRKSGGIAGVAPPMPGAVPVLPVIGSVPVSGMNTVGRSTPTLGVTGVLPTWVVTPAEKLKSDAMFVNLDMDHDGLVSGAEIRDVLAQSGLSTAVLAHIWGLCDSQGVGKLTAEQFALAMHLIQQKLLGIDPPPQLLPEMIPPSLRSVADPGAFGVRDGTNAGPYSHVADFSAIKELDMISKEIEDIKNAFMVFMTREKLKLERDKSQQEADIKIRHGEVQVMQKELDSLNATLIQLDAQKKEAQKRLDELEDKRSNLERSVQELREKTSKEQMEDQEKELEKLRSELTKLREEESRLEQTVDSSKQQLDQLAKSQGEINAEIISTRNRLKLLTEQCKAIEPSIGGYTGFNGDSASNIDAASSRATVGSPVSTISNFSGGSTLDDDPFKGRDPFGGGNAGPDDPFQNDDPFVDDPFKAADPFGGDDLFKDTFASSSKADPFSSSADPFASSGAASKKVNIDDGFDAFGLSWGTSTAQSSHMVNSFGDDPFGDSSKSNISSKNKKAPPPRPAPPKSKSPLPFGSTLSAAPKPKLEPFGVFGSDPFANSDPFAGNKPEGNGASEPFSNFADFSPGKFSLDDDDAWGGGGPSIITVKKSDLSSAKPLPAKRNITFKTRTSDETEA
ncbi:epidermal growth factor receptor substrate 15-like 1 isoform X3 [Biomphalaria glabrata]|uniref:Epidermal growth factor receptor substrate 15-like 1 isoform X3 n=2 Tax=Biomphalaria glabrata TaxID=6526 RepID=A0A9W3ACR6_BIOGL|nr:epidermal growth factor receptor substrate 15-like 1 isoform X3 [Biomphalaria glabrata]